MSTKTIHIDDVTQFKLGDRLASGAVCKQTVGDMTGPYFRDEALVAGFFIGPTTLRGLGGIDVLRD